MVYLSNLCNVIIHFRGSVDVEPFEESIVTNAHQITSNTSNLILVKTASGKNVVLKVVPQNSLEVSTVCEAYFNRGTYACIYVCFS